MRVKGILELFGIRKPNAWNASIDATITKYQQTHYAQIECLVCQAILRGADPMKLEIVRESRGTELITRIRERKGVNET